jgi:protein involved in polysaccharide export with SLBB domain
MIVASHSLIVRSILQFPIACLCGALLLTPPSFAQNESPKPARNLEDILSALNDLEKHLLDPAPQVTHRNPPPERSTPPTPDVKKPIAKPSVKAPKTSTLRNAADTMPLRQSKMPPKATKKQPSTKVPPKNITRPPVPDPIVVKALPAETPPKITPGFSWREAYKLGPGDTLKCSLYGRIDMTRDAITVSPDGTLSYLSAAGVPVAGLTIQEARVAVEQELAADFPNARLVLLPVTLASKQYIIIGQVKNSGTYPMSHPVTLLEAIAQSGGIASGIINFQTRELANFNRSFVVRNGQRLAVDFGKLYLEGDLSQNIAIEPNDYIYLASSTENEYYVFGAVQKPGSQIFAPGTTVVSALSQQSGFSEGAWRKRILLVRGSLEKPMTTAINVDHILAGKTPDLQLHPQDILYVSTEPWHAAEKLLDSAIIAFLQSASSTYIDVNVSKPSETQ